MIDPVAFYLGPLAIRWYGIIMSLAVVTGVFLVLRQASRQGLDSDFFLDFFIYGIPAAIIGARLYYVVFEWDKYRSDLWRIFATREGGLAIHGAIVGGLIVLIILTRKRKQNFWQVSDILAPALVLGQAIGRWGNFINQEAHGGVVSREFISHFPGFIQNQMYIGGKYYHPTFFYESLWNLLIFLCLIYLRRKEDLTVKGDIFLTYLAGYSLGRFFIEGMRTDSLMIGPLRVAQLVSLGLIVLSVSLIISRHSRGRESRD